MLPRSCFERGAQSSAHRRRPFKGTQLWHHSEERAEKAKEPLTDDDGWGSCMPVFVSLPNMRDIASN